MSPYEEAFIRVTLLLDEPNFHTNRQQIKDHLDTMIDLSASDAEKRAAYDFKGMALNHVDSVGKDRPDLMEEKRVRALKAAQVVTHVIEDGKYRQRRSSTD